MCEYRYEMLHSKEKAEKGGQKRITDHKDNQKTKSSRFREIYGFKMGLEKRGWLERGEETRARRRNKKGKQRCVERKK